MKSDNELVALVKEAAEIMEIVYAGNFPAGIESFLVRAHRAIERPNKCPHGCRACQLTEQLAASERAIKENT